MRAPTVVLALLLAASVHAPVQAATTPDQDLLRAPADYSLGSAAATPPDAGLLPGSQPSLVKGGVISQSFGSGGYRSTAVRLDSGLLGGSTRAFLEAGTGQGPQFHGRPVVQGSSVAVGVESEILRGVTVGVVAGWERDRFGAAGGRWGGGLP